MNIEEIERKLDQKTKLIDELYVRKRELITLHRGLPVPELLDVMAKIEKEERNLANFKFRHSEKFKQRRQELIKELTQKRDDLDIFS